ncbi:NAD(P)/FAD-dependent oxidoreductase [Marinobacter salarius]|uniref:NAD(P)/FAD-dependent oxidoreductase n=1 Tax=Marinobacter salarius TaxID=1420917 RepID=UPI001D18829D|nr:NAD(P)/FAD-dependent oxidoreductase [Marinobacter salarius]MCC4282820.1 NAD(P)/FAD-dependent oxidoreductase [Marinobacter salarius]
MDSFSTDAIVIGAGVVGLAIANKLSEQGKEVFVLEANSCFGAETSSRNSEVIHAGIYYPTGSLKAELCIKGRRALYEYAERHRIPCKQIGKWLIATTDDQAERLGKIQNQAAENGVKLEWASRQAISEHLPGTRVKTALWSPETGILDSHKLMLSMVKEIEARGSHVVYNTRATQIIADNSGHCVQVVDRANKFYLFAPEIVNSAGLDSVALANRCNGLAPECVPNQYFAKGSYFSYGAKHPFKSLVYPLPEEAGLGIHLTLDLGGNARFGPNVEWMEEPNLTVSERLREHFFNAIRAWWPTIKKGSLSPAYAGIRPKIKGPGQGSFDFQISGPEDHGLEGMVHLYGIESPGLTASLAIADSVAAKLKA